MIQSDRRSERSDHAKLHGASTTSTLDACQAAVTLIMSSDAILKFRLERLTISYVISDSAYLISSAVSQTDPTWISLQLYSLATLHDD